MSKSFCLRRCHIRTLINMYVLKLFCKMLTYSVLIFVNCFYGNRCFLDRNKYLYDNIPRYKMMYMHVTQHQPFFNISHTSPTEPLYLILLLAIFMYILSYMSHIFLFLCHANFFFPFCPVLKKLAKIFFIILNTNVDV